MEQMSEIEEAICEIARDVYKQLGSGHLETVYHAAMEVGLRLRGIAYETKRVVAVVYEGYCVGREEADLVVGDIGAEIVVELKTVADRALGPPEEQQLRNYLTGLDIASGLLINFPSPAGRKKQKQGELEPIEVTPNFLRVTR